MSRVLRVALTETVNAYESMPGSLADLGALAAHLDDVRAANVAHHIVLLRRAAEAGAAVVGLGELFTGPYFALSRDPMWFGLAEDARSGPTVSALRQTAQELQLVVVAPIYELDGDSGERFNTAVIIESDGSLAGLYRKNHIPHGENERAGFHEDFYYGPGRGDLGQWPANFSTNPFFPVFQTSVGRLGVAICYDRHFAGVMATLAEQGAELVFSPAVTFGVQSQRLWSVEFAVDAARHGMFIAGSNRRGLEPPFAVEFFGESHVVGPNGRLPNLDVHPNLVICDVDLDELSAGVASGWQLKTDARPEIYGSEL
ncbi:MAG: beta-ureidopropionase [Pseudohongiellaceae bacterium]|jgi:beta-ureidopropionase